MVRGRVVSYAFVTAIDFRRVVGMVGGVDRGGAVESAGSGVSDWMRDLEGFRSGMEGDGLGLHLQSTGVPGSVAPSRGAAAT